MATLPTARYRRVYIPDDVDDPAIVKASGRVVLPPHVRWSAPLDIEYDLSDPRHRRSVYIQVMTEGLEEDVRHFIDVAALAGRHGFWRLCDLARDKQLGLDPGELLHSLGAFPTWPREEFELSNEGYDRLRTLVETWRRELTQRTRRRPDWASVPGPLLDWEP